MKIQGMLSEILKLKREKYVVKIWEKKSHKLQKSRKINKIGKKKVVKLQKSQN